MTQEVKKWFRTIARLIEENPGLFAHRWMIIGDVLFDETNEGVYIIPRDGSYVRFIRDSWYDGVNPESL